MASRPMRKTPAPMRQAAGWPSPSTVCTKTGWKARFSEVSIGAVNRSDTALATK